MTGPGHAVGGFFGLELPRSSAASFAGLWGLTSRELTFINARSAFASLIKNVEPGRVWLPAFICQELAGSVSSSLLRYYPLDDDLSPDTTFLRSRVTRRDLVLGVNFFGRAPSKGFLEFAADLADLTLVEDCAQAIDTGLPSWGDWRLFSPRKVLGVPDGGLLVAGNGGPDRTELRGSSPPAPLEEHFRIFRPSILRFEDEDEQRSHAWHLINQEKEGSEQISEQPMTRLSWSLLGLLDPMEAKLRREANFAVLAAKLEPWALIKDLSPSFVPFGFPVLVPARDRSRLLQSLYGQRIFPAVHWANLPSPATEFPQEHELASRIMTLPCDHRYQAADMERVADAFIRAAA